MRSSHVSMIGQTGIPGLLGNFESKSWTYMWSSHVSPGLCLWTPHVSPEACANTVRSQLLTDGSPTFSFVWLSCTACDNDNLRAGSQIKKCPVRVRRMTNKVRQKLGSRKMWKLENLILGKCWTTFVFISMLKSQCLLPKIACFFDNTFSSTLSCEFRVHRAGSQLKMEWTNKGR